MQFPLAKLIKALPTASCRFKRAGTWLAPTGPPSCRRASGFGAAVSSSGPLLCAELTRLVSGPPPSWRQPSVVGPVRDRSRARNRPTDQEPRQCRASDWTAAVRGTANAGKARKRASSCTTRTSDVAAEDQRPADSARAERAAETDVSPGAGSADAGGSFRGDEGGPDERSACHEGHGACSVKRSRRPRRWRASRARWRRTGQGAASGSPGRQPVVPRLQPPWPAGLLRLL